MKITLIITVALVALLVHEATATCGEKPEPKPDPKPDPNPDLKPKCGGDGGPPKAACGGEKPECVGGKCKGPKDGCKSKPKILLPLKPKPGPKPGPEPKKCAKTAPPPPPPVVTTPPKKPPVVTTPPKKPPVVTSPPKKPPVIVRPTSSHPPPPKKWNHWPPIPHMDCDPVHETYMPFCDFDINTRPGCICDCRC